MIQQTIGEVAWSDQPGEDKAADLFIEDVCDYRLEGESISISQAQGEPARVRTTLPGCNVSSTWTN